MNRQTRRDRLREIQTIADSLRAPVEAPDLTHAILDRVHAERPFLRHGTRRWVPVVRLALGAATLTLLAGVLVIQRTAPESTSWAGRAQPLSSVVDSVGREAARLGGPHRFRMEPLGIGRVDATFTPVRPAVPDDSATATFVLAAPAAPPQASVVGYVAYAEAPAVYRPVFFNDTYQFDRFEPGNGSVPSAWTMPAFPVRRMHRNLLGDLAPIITGQPAGEGLIPR